LRAALTVRDRSPLSTIALAARQATGKRRLTAIADRGYYSGMDLTAYEEMGLPHLFPSR